MLSVNERMKFSRKILKVETSVYVKSMNRNRLKLLSLSNNELFISRMATNSFLVRSTSKIRSLPNGRILLVDHGENCGLFDLW